MGGAIGKGGGSDTQTVKQQPWGPAQPYLTGGTVGGQEVPIYSQQGQGSPMQGVPGSGGRGASIQYDPRGIHAGQSAGQNAGQIVGYEQQGGTQVPGVLPEAASLYQQYGGMSPMQQQGMGYLGNYAQEQLPEMYGQAQSGLQMMGSPAHMSADPTGQIDYLGSGEAGQPMYGAGQSMEFLASGDVLSPDSNPYLRETADAYADAVNEQLRRTTLSDISDQSVQSGQGWGSSREAIEAGLARGEASERIADRTSQLYSDAYQRGLGAMQSGISLAQGQQRMGLDARTDAANLAQNQYGMGLDAMGRSISMAPQVANLGMMPGQTMMNVGGMPQQEAQADLSNYANIINQVASQGGQQVTPQSSGGLPGLLGGAASGAGIAQSLGASSPWGWGLTAAGGLLGSMG